MNRTHFLFLACALVLYLIGTSPQAGAAGQPVDQPACKVALRLLTSPAYIRAHLGEIPDADKLNETQQVDFISALFRDSVTKKEDQELFCTTTIKENLRYAAATPLPQTCAEFLPKLKKSFEAKAAYKTDVAKQVQSHMDDSLTEMLVLGETEPAQLLSRCQVGMEVMQVNLNDKHLAQRYPLPVSCEALFADMEKTLILPAQLETLRRQRVIFFLENKNTPEKLETLCQQISQ